MTSEAIHISIGNLTLDGDLHLPDNPAGVIIFAHGSGSSRHSPRNRYVAEHLNEGGFATLLMDLLTVKEEHADAVTGHLRFDIPFLAHRLAAATDFLARRPETRELRQGYFGASTGGGAAIVAATFRPDLIAAIVSRGGRPDLAGESLVLVRAPTLLIVGGNDTPVIGMNEDAMTLLQCEKHLEIVPGATHLFEEPGALESVANLALGWFQHHMIPISHPTP